MATQAVPTPDTNWTGLFETRNREVHDRMDSIFKKLLIAQWVALVVIALVVSPSSWNGGEKGVHMHVWLALLGGGAVALFPLFLTASEGSTRVSRSVTASAQVVFSSLLIHILGGRIEAHFHLFVSLAIIAAYRDYVPLLAATAIAAVDHIVRGVFFPASLFGVDQASFLRVLEHLVYAVFEVGVLCITIRMSLEETRRSAKLQAESVEESRRQQEDQIVRAQEAVRAFIESKVSHALTGINEMANAIEVNSVAAGELANHSNENGRLAEEGNRAMGDMIDQIQQLVGAIDDGQGQLEALQASSTQIRQVTKLIEDLAFQTNLLALNAAVEAARAGEYGSGFAVVAEEVRALAVRTSSAVTEIDEMTTSIAQETDSVRSTISGASERAAASMAVVRDARQRLEAVEQSSETMAQLVSSVAAATDEQSVSSRELAQLVEGFTKYGSDG